MELLLAVERTIGLLIETLDRLEEEEYRFPCAYLSGNTVGQHVRHIIEMFQCLESGYQKGEVDYENRKRDHRIEREKERAIRMLKETARQMNKSDKAIFLLINPAETFAAPEKIRTSYFREISYNLEHTVHHMALIRVGLREIGRISVDESFGVSASTLKYRKKCVQ